MFKYSDEDLLSHLKRVENCKSLPDLVKIMKENLSLKSYVIQHMRSLGDHQQKNYVASSGGMPEILIDRLNTAYTDRLGPIGQYLIRRGKPIWFSDILNLPEFKTMGYSTTSQKLFDLTGDGIFIPSFYKNHWCVSLATFGKEKQDCHEILLWQTGTLFHELHIRYRSIRDEFQTKVDLTSREVDVIDLIAIGKTNGEIAEILGIKSSTVASYVKNIYLKLGVSNRVTATLRAIYLDLGTYSKL